MFVPVKMILTYPIYHAIERAVFTSRAFEKTWSALSPKLEKGIELIAGEVHPAGPSLIRKYVYQEPAMRRIVNECMNEMFCSDVMALLTQVRRIRKDVAKRKKEILNLEKDMIAAPKKSWNPFDFSQSKLKNKIHAAQTRINVDTKRIDEIIEDSLERLRSRGVRMSREQIDSLLNTAEGEDIAAIMSVADTVKQIFARLEHQLTETHPSAELSKTYAGFYMMCNRIYLEAIDKAIYKIDRHYMPAIEKIEANTQTQVANAQKHIAHYYASENHKMTLKTNIQINERTLEVAKFYSRHLRNRAKELLELREKARQNYEVSLNTFLTMKIGADLVDIIRSSKADLIRVFEFEPPAFSEHYAAGFNEQFNAITNEIKRH